MTATLSAPIRLGVVNFINTLPLIDGLEGLADVDLVPTVPSLLIDALLAGEVEIALCSSIDYQRSMEPLVVVPAGQLGCTGPTLTVRLYSQSPIESLARVYADTDSHTSVALLQILLREIYAIDPEIVPYDAREHVANRRPLEWPEAMLLIGDKVVTDSPPAVRYPHQLDLGEAWLGHTGHPFVFAIWMARQSLDAERLHTAFAVLDHQRRHNEERIDRMIHDRAVPRGWPRDLAEVYLKERLDYAPTPERMEGLAIFFRKAHEHGIVGDCRTVHTAS
ncbi:MAG: menaquinone biosynthetic enzyme MqnA/MqnD family protein [Planctomycetota bacterium]|jgi:chorismate dehydratase